MHALWWAILVPQRFLGLFQPLLHQGPQKPLTPLLLLFSHSVVSNSLRPHGLKHARLPCPSPSPGVCWNSCPFESVIPSNHLILCCPLLLLPSVFPSIRVFSKESVLLIRWPKDWSFSFNISPSNEYSGLISFRMDWLDLLAVHRTFNNLLQHHNLKSINSLVLSLIYGPTLHPYMTTGKTIPLTGWIYVGKVMSLFLFCFVLFLIYCLGL